MQKWVYRNPKIEGAYLVIQRVSDSTCRRAVGYWKDSKWWYGLNGEEMRCVACYTFLTPVPEELGNPLEDLT